MLRTACQGSYCLVAASHPQPAKLTPRQRRLQKQRNQWKQQRQQQQTAPPPPPPPRSPPPPPERRLHQGLGTPDAATLQLECPHFDSCSGCTLDKQLERPPVLEDAERFFEETGLVHFKLHTGRSQRWRRRARLAVRQGPGGEPAIGLFEEGSHTVTPIPACTVHHPAINEAVQLVHEALAACRIQPYDEASGTGQLRYLQLTAVEEAPGSGQPAAVQLVLVWNCQPGDSGQGRRLQAFADHLWQAGQLRFDSTRLLHSIWCAAAMDGLSRGLPGNLARSPAPAFRLSSAILRHLRRANFQPDRTNTILGPNWLLLHGELWAWARLGGVDVCFGPGSFMQANFEAMGSALAAMQRFVPVGATITDLHAGVGTIGLSLAATRAPRWVEFVEINGQGLPLFQHPAAGEAGVRRLLYLSCGWPALKRDAAALLASGHWRLRHAECFLFFPGSDHIETLTVWDAAGCAGSAEWSLASD
ncbi:hypothetical protein COHA_001860 [Chlorella ohadii]|uniref:Uncharacterized protein n=1 Tax=Chlorella ohadii TaxID=2649997 RepID=A0AAD5DYA7_9CHLO|nr:hypothetical protein COHA_001860 [Chlorella ohadii]